MEISQKTIDDLEWKILELKAQRKNQVDNKLRVQAKLSTATEEEKPELKLEAGKVEKKISDLNQTIKKMNVMHTEALRMLGSDTKRSKSVESQLYILIKKYRSFAKDRTRISSLRVMANEISDELENIVTQ